MRDALISDAKNALENNHVTCDLDESKIERLEEIKVKAGSGLPSISVGGTHSGAASVNSSVTHSGKPPIGLPYSGLPRNSNRDDKNSASNRQKHHESLPPLKKAVFAPKHSDAPALPGSKTSLHSKQQIYNDLSGK